MSVMLACFAPETSGVDDGDFGAQIPILGDLCLVPEMCAADNGPESEYKIPILGEPVYEMPIKSLSKAQVHMLTEYFIESRIVDLSALDDDTQISHRMLMDLGARFPDALAFVLPQSALDALNPTTPCADDEGELDAPTAWWGSAEEDDFAKPANPTAKKKPSSPPTSPYGQIEETGWDKAIAVVTFAPEEKDEEPEDLSNDPLTANALAAFAVAHPKTLIYVPLLLGSTAATVVALYRFAESGVLDLGKPVRDAHFAAHRIHADGKHAFEVEMMCHIRMPPLGHYE